MSKVLGVAVGRFQVDQLHEGHRLLLDHVVENSDDALILLGVGPLPTSHRKPLPYETRKAILLKEYPELSIEPIFDRRHDSQWLDDLYTMCLDRIGSEDVAVLFGSRDSFLEYVEANPPASDKIIRQYVEHADTGISGTLHRNRIGTHPGVSREFAHGVIWAHHNIFPAVYPTVDIAVTCGEKILCIRKPDSHLWQLPGGFSEPDSPSYEQDAIREALEETGMTLLPDEVEYVGNWNIPDWRYDSEPHQIRTLLFHADITDLELPFLQAGDDAEEAAWLPLDMDLTTIAVGHRPLIETIKERKA